MKIPNEKKIYKWKTWAKEETGPIKDKVINYYYLISNYAILSLRCNNSWLFNFYYYYSMRYFDQSATFYYLQTIYDVFGRISYILSFIPHCYLIRAVEQYIHIISKQSDSAYHRDNIIFILIITKWTNYNKCGTKNNKLNHNQINVWSQLEAFDMKKHLINLRYH